jgi:hypothetical protein
MGQRVDPVESNDGAPAWAEAREWRTPRKWAPDAASPFGATRVLDPEPIASVNRDAPAAGRLAADNIITADRPIVDPAAFRFERFAGSRPRPMAGV